MKYFLLFAPFLLIAPAAAAPTPLEDDAGPGCAIVTVMATKTVYADATPDVSPLAFTEKYAPAATQSALAVPNDKPSPDVVAPPASPAVQPTVDSQGGGAPNAGATTGHPRGSYNNALYFTNWFVLASPNLTVRGYHANQHQGYLRC